jgi:EAL domain-containing protein (putative c-di-GMP-specific phosphodiesterase class I)
MLADACGQMAAWRRQFGPAAPDTIAVNVSSVQFSDEGLADVIEAMLGRTGLEPGSLKLEITESAFLGDIPAAQTTLERIQRMGIQWSLDDFGTGYSSLSYLQKLPIDTLKIDRSFVGRIGHETDGFEMIRAIVTLAHSLGMDVVAEGVETIQQAAGLDSLGCEYAQGFYFSRPVDSATAARLIGAQPWRRAGDPGSSDDRTATQLSLV